MKDKLLFWLDQDFTHFGIGYYLQKKYEFDFYAIIDITDLSLIHISEPTRPY